MKELKYNAKCNRYCNDVKYCANSKGDYLVGGEGCFIKDALFELNFEKEEWLEQEKIKEERFF